MDITKLQQHPLVDDMPVGGEVISLTWDAYKFAGAAWRRMAQVYRERVNEAVTLRGTKEQAKRKASLTEKADYIACRIEANAAMDDLDKEVFADILASDRYGILIEWGVTRGGATTTPTYDELMTLPEALLRDVFSFCRLKSLPNQKKVPTTEGESSTTEINSPTSDT